SVAAWAYSSGVNQMAAEGLHSKLGRVFHLPYIVEKPATDTIGEIIRALEAGQHVVLSFGNHESDLDYLLVSNLLTRRIRDAWETSTNNFRSSGKSEPRPLVIVVEEAHKLLNREMAAQTTFSTIAREMRKYYVTLLIVDQRPSQIYDEVMSQLGTRISGWLGDEDDIHAVLSGLAGRDALRGMLARLQPKEEVLLLGWGVPMPLPVRSRRYDDRFWEELLGKSGTSGRTEKDILKELGF
ncbi:MAG TPA: ATP-binding protein, partial [Anaerolineales bacterium]